MLFYCNRLRLSIIMNVLQSHACDDYRDNYLLGKLKGAVLTLTKTEGLYLKMAMVTPGPLAVEDLRDANDLPILAALVSANADVIVTGDQDLLVLRDRYNVETPAEFLRRL